VTSAAVGLDVTYGPTIIISRQRCHNAMQILNKLIPGFEAKAAAVEDIEAFCAPVCLQFPDISHEDILIRNEIKLQAAANDARSDDTSKLKVVIAEWLYHLGGSDPTLPTNVRGECSKYNDITARLLCPIQYDWDDPECVIHTSLPA
jgi:hypothetical protein